MLENETWLLPSLFLNNKAIARGGYIPIEEELISEIKKQQTNV